MNRKCIRITALFLALTAVAAPLSGWSSVPVSAETKTIEQINKEKKEKQEQINKKKEQLAALSDDLSKKAQYEQTLNEQIGLITDKLTLIDSQLQELHVNMEDTEEKIGTLETQIAEQKEQVAKDMELFKKRIRALYVHGNDGILSALVGATSFYDILSRIDIIKRIARHDNEIIERLRDEIQELSKSEQELTANLQALNIQETEMNVLCDEFRASQDELNLAAAQNSTEMQTIRGQQNGIHAEITADQHAMEELDEEAEKMIAEIIAKAEAERKAKEDAEKKAKEAAERKAKEEAEQKAKAEAERKAKEEAARKAAEDAQRQAVVTQAPANQKQNAATVTTAVPAAPVTAPPVTTKAPETTATPVTTAAPQQNTNGKLAWPAPGYYHISSGFGPRWGTHHSGIDICGSATAIAGAAACAAASGKVIAAEGGCTHNYGKDLNKWTCHCNYGYGNYIILDHGNGLYTLYAHLASFTVSVGQNVTVGQQIGVIGSTGDSTGAHLHFEVRKGANSANNRVDPELYLP